MAQTDQNQPRCNILDRQVAMAFFSRCCWFLGQSAWKKSAPGDRGVRILIHPSQGSQSPKPSSESPNSEGNMATKACPVRGVSGSVGKPLPIPPPPPTGRDGGGFLIPPNDLRATRNSGTRELGGSGARFHGFLGMRHIQFSGTPPKVSRVGFPLWASL